MKVIGELMSRVFPALVVAVAALSLSACGTDDPNDTRVTSCTTDFDCGIGRYCGPDNLCRADCASSADCDAPATCDSTGRCVVPGECQDDTDCAQPPAPICDGNSAVAYSAQGTCVIGTAESTCEYVPSSTSCQNGCVDGACAQDACATVVCETPPGDRCDGDVLVSYQSQGLCDAGVCDYPETRRTCPLGCANGACNDGTCDNVTCDQPPAAVCDDDVVVTYSGTGTCVDDSGNAECVDFDIDFEHCGYTKSECNNAQCGTAVTQVGGVVIVEVFPDPVGSFGDNDEWFEIVNVSGSEVDLTGWTIRSGSSDGTVEEHVIAAPVPAFPNGGRLLMSRSSAIFETTIGIDYVYGSDIGLGNGSDWIELVNTSGEIADYLFWEAGSILDGRSRKLSTTMVADAMMNDDFSNWCPSMGDEFSASNFGTPGAENTPCEADPCASFTCVKPEGFCRDDVSAVGYEFETDPPQCEITRFNNPLCPYRSAESTCMVDSQLCVRGVCEDFGPALMPGDVIITELLPNPASPVSDADGEFIELHNTTQQEVVLFGNYLEVDDRTRIEDPAARIPAGGYLVFIRDADPAVNGGVQNALEISGGFTLNNSGTADTVRVLDRNMTVIDEATYALPTPAGQSYQLRWDGSAYVAGEWCYTANPSPGSDNQDLTCN
jgi:hypothetical protein